VAFLDLVQRVRKRTAATTGLSALPSEGGRGGKKENRYSPGSKRKVTARTGECRSLLYPFYLLRAGGEGGGKEGKTQLLIFK